MAVVLAVKAVAWAIAFAVIYSLHPPEDAEVEAIYGLMVGAAGVLELIATLAVTLPVFLWLARRRLTAGGAVVGGIIQGSVLGGVFALFNGSGGETYFAADMGLAVGIAVIAALSGWAVWRRMKRAQDQTEVF